MSESQAAGVGAGPLVPTTVFDPEHRVVAVTGAHSFLGTEVIRRLERDRRFAKVLAIDIRRPNVPLTKTQFYKIDLTLPGADGDVARILKREQADTVVHLAFLSKPTHNTNWAHELEAIGTLHVLNACAACKVHKFIMSSLAALYGPAPQNPNFLTEEHPLRGVPDSRFFTDKLEAERLAHRFRKENPGTTVTILRLANVVGRRIHNYVSNYLAMSVVPVMMGHDPLVQLLHEDDATAVLKLAIDADFNADYNVAGDGVLPLSTVLALAGRVSIPIPHAIAHPLAKVLWMTQVFDVPPVYLDFMRYLCVVDTSKIQKEMGFRATRNIRQIIGDFMAQQPDDGVRGWTRRRRTRDNATVGRA